jgi:hypothetical protein
MAANEAPTPGGAYILASSVTREPTAPHNPSDSGGRTSSPLPPRQPGPRGPEHGLGPITPNTKPLGIGYPSDQNKTQQ